MMPRPAMLIILMMLAHALFMTSQVNVHDQQAIHPHQMVAAASSLSLEKLAHDVHCFTVQAADSSTKLPLVQSRSLSSVRTLVPEGRSRISVALIPPQRPPAVFRALLQVYRV